jgi:hypothetical protein
LKYLIKALKPITGKHQNNRKFWEEPIAYFSLMRMDRIANDGSNNSCIVACVFVAAVTFLRSRSLATIDGYTYERSDRWEGFMKCAAEMGSGVVVYTYIAGFIKTAAAIHKLIGGDTHTQTARRSHTPTFTFSK